MTLIQQKRNECLNLVRVSNRVLNEVRYSDAETESHRLVKEAICILLKKQNKHFLTEAIFIKGGLRADILCLDTFTVIEIAVTESEESLEQKKVKCQELGLNIEIIRIKT